MFASIITTESLMLQCQQATAELVGLYITDAHFPWWQRIGTLEGEVGDDPSGIRQ